VVATSPAAGQQAAADTAVTLQVSGGAAEFTVPNSIVGLNEQQARQALTAAGFTGTVDTADTEAEPGQADGTVVGSDPQPGQTVAPDGTITLLIARQTTTTPPGDTGGGGTGAGGGGTGGGGTGGD
jgi:serine/threonine-protein kinase